MKKRKLIKFYHRVSENMFEETIVYTGSNEKKGTGKFFRYATEEDEGMPTVSVLSPKDFSFVKLVRIDG